MVRVTCTTDRTGMAARLCVRSCCMLLLMGVLVACDSSVSAATGTALLDGVKDSEIVVHAEVREVGPSLGFWSGFMPALQRVTYGVVRVYKGEVAEGEELAVDHILVGSEPAADDEPRLRPDLFQPGRQVVLFIQTEYPGLQKGLYVVGDKPVGVLFVRGEDLLFE